MLQAGSRCHLWSNRRSSYIEFLEVKGHGANQRRSVVVENLFVAQTFSFGTFFPVDQLEIRSDLPKYEK